MSKQEFMGALVAEIRNCRRCRLWRGAKNPIPGEGDLDTPLMLIGEAPGYWEDVIGRPFMGAAGKLLDELLSSIELKRGEVYICNIIKHRPPGNRDPRQDEIEACTHFLERQIQIIKPKIIVSMGKHSTKFILSKVGIKVRGINDVRGQVYKEDLFSLSVRIIPILHPAAALYDRSYEPILKKDFQKIRSILK